MKMQYELSLSEWHLILRLRQISKDEKPRICLVTVNPMTISIPEKTENLEPEKEKVV
jgi:hypothetical protein